MAAVITTVQVVAVTGVQPVRLTKLEPASGFAVSVTAVNCLPAVSY